VNCKCDVFALGIKDLELKKRLFRRVFQKRHVKAKLENKVLKAKA
jgi:hypothetical protein